MGRASEHSTYGSFNMCQVTQEARMKYSQHCQEISTLVPMPLRGGLAPLLNTNTLVRTSINELHTVMATYILISHMFELQMHVVSGVVNYTLHTLVPGAWKGGLAELVNSFQLTQGGNCKDVGKHPHRQIAPARQMCIMSNEVEKCSM